MSIVAGFYRTCVIDDLLEHSPADHVRRPNVPPESPTLGLSHLQLQALLTAARLSPNTSDFALVCLLGLLGLHIFEACALDIGDLGEEHGTPRPTRRRQRPQDRPHPLTARSRPLRRPRHRRPPGRAAAAQHDRRPPGPPLGHPATPASLAEDAGVRLPRMHPHMLRHTDVTTMLDAGVDLRDVQIAARHADPRTTMRYDRARTTLARHPNYILAAHMASGT